MNLQPAAGDAIDWQRPWLLPYAACADLAPLAGACTTADALNASGQAPVRFVPQSALIADQEGVYVFVVEDGKAVVKRIKPGGESGTDTVVQARLERTNAADYNRFGKIIKDLGIEAD